MKEKSFETMVSEIAALTDSNNHTEAAILGAVLLKNRHFQNIFSGIKLIADAENCMPFDLNEYRYKKIKELWSFAEQELSKEKYEMFYKAF